MHSPITKTHQNAKGIVFFIHGFMGSPNQFESLAQAAYEAGYTVKAILLPGHGGSVREFTRQGMAEWQEYVNAEIAMAMKTAARIFLVGHSMGGLLALNACRDKKHLIAGVFVIASPFKLYSLAAKPLWAMIKLFLFSDYAEMRRVYVKSCSIARTPLRLLNPALLRPVRELKKLMKQTRRVLPEIKTPAVLIYSSRDEIVAIKSAKLLFHELGAEDKKRIILTDSWHVYYTQSEQKRIVSELLLFLSARERHENASGRKTLALVGPFDRHYTGTPAVDGPV